MSRSRFKIKVVYIRVNLVYSSCMSRMTTSTAIMARLFCRLEGGGEMLGSVPAWMRDLAERLVREDGPPGYDVMKAFKEGRDVRLRFALAEGVAPIVKDVRNIPEAVLRKDAPQVRELLLRIGAHPLVEMRALLREEWDYLLECVGEGPWQRVLPYLD